MPQRGVDGTVSRRHGGPDRQVRRRPAHACLGGLLQAQVREAVSEDRAPRVSNDDLSQILLTSAYPALRITIGTHGGHLARWRRRKAVTDGPDAPQDGPPSTETPSPMEMSCPPD